MERYGVLPQNTEYSKRKESERSDKNSERSDKIKGLERSKKYRVFQMQRCEKDMQRCTHKCTQKG